MWIQNNILRYYLRNAFFLNGTACAGKSTTAKRLADRYDMILCGENYHDAVARQIKNPKQQPALCYFEQMSDWQEFLNRSPEEYARWICRGSAEAAEIEVAELIALSAAGKKMIVDTNIAPELLHEISDERHVAIMLCPQSLSVERFFDRSDPDKRFLLEQIEKAKDPERTMANFRACIARINSPEVYASFANSGFFTLVREDSAEDTREAVADAVARHFGLL